MKANYPGDSRTYEKYKLNGRYYVKCCQTREENGKIYVCSFCNKREDRFKESLKKGNLHICEFIEQKKIRYRF